MVDLEDLGSGSKTNSLILHEKNGMIKVKTMGVKQKTMRLTDNLILVALKMAKY